MASSFLILLLLGSAVSAQETSSDARIMANVLQVMANLKADISANMANESSVYQQYACFCKDESNSKSGKVMDDNRQIELLKSVLEDKTAEKAQQDREKARQEGILAKAHKDMQDTMYRCLKEDAEFEQLLAEDKKAIKTMDDAKRELQAGNAYPEATQLVQKSMAVADAMGLVDDSKSKKMNAFLQKRVDPSSPEYQSVIQTPLELLTNLETDLVKQKEDLELNGQWGKEACRQMKQGYEDLIETTESTIEQLKASIAVLVEEIAKAREDLVLFKAATKDDRDYLADITSRCEARAREHDQRYAMMQEEMRVIDQAVAELHGAPALVQAKKVPSTKSSVSLLQLSSSYKLSAQEQQARVESILRSSASSLSSPVLAALANQVSGSPFDKLKLLIHDLIGSLLDEAKEEAEKKAYCDAAVAKAAQQKEFKEEAVKTAEAQVSVFESRAATLQDEIRVIGEDIAELQAGLNSAAAVRRDDSAANAAAIADLQESVVATNKAIEILTTFYQKAGAAQVESYKGAIDTVYKRQTDEGAQGAYRGNIDQGEGVIGLLNSVIADIKTQIDDTVAQEKSAKQAFIEFERTAEASIHGKEKESGMKTQDLDFALDNAQKAREDITTNTELVQAAVQEIEELAPECKEVQLDYERKMAKSAAERASLKKALCTLDGSDNEPECKESA